MRILFKFASRSRPEKFFRCLDNIHLNCKSGEFIILATLDSDDQTMTGEDAVQRLTGYEKVVADWGTSSSKIDAVNRGMSKIREWDILINTSDDMWFTEEGFDDIIREDMKKHFPDLDGVLHYNDGNQKDNVMTMSIMGRKYFERFGYIYHPSYISLWSDMEAMLVARQMDKIVYLGDSKILFRHLHPAWGLCEFDAQYRKTESKETWTADEHNFEMRRSNNFYISGK